jgi:hypothetical protein
MLRSQPQKARNDRTRRALLNQSARPQLEERWNVDVHWFNIARPVVSSLSEAVNAALTCVHINVEIYVTYTQVANINDILCFIFLIFT